KLLFGNSTERPLRSAPPAHELFGHAVHHVLRARFCIERGRLWQAEYWISDARDFALNLACHRRGLQAMDGRGLDDLPRELLQRYRDALVVSLDRKELLRALERVTNLLISEAEEVREKAAALEPQLYELTREWAD